MSEKKTRALVNERSDGLCERCSCPGHSIHHRLKLSQGGPWSASNCVRLCGDGVRLCHGWVEHNPDAARAEGFHVRSFEDPKTIPVNSIHGRVLLLDDGTTEPAPGDI